MHRLSHWQLTTCAAVRFVGLARYPVKTRHAGSPSSRWRSPVLPAVSRKGRLVALL
jgi:hypothetical protein